MKTKKEILKMNRKELINYKWHDDLKILKDNSNYTNCYNCSDCSNCSNCSDCSNCRNLKTGEKHQYKICNVQLTKEEYEKKMEELKGKK